ncbi:Cof-type HAD-IIB family hydrolase [Fictibacillus sp. Mic-4]|uniref:Cof-type HAD-IIB family hydrolase n=1 Tax=Fictibacillus TaxID=1329200 RepID=UPI00040F5043|nr:Cof-type HAD-IIB family hydrolase [Fictibacillus gelatini]
MEGPYLIAVDLDGTLLTDNKNISPRTKNALLNAMEKGHHVCISTGRPWRSSYMYYNELGLNSPIVNFNGAYVHHPHNKDFGYYHSPLDLTIAKNIIKTCEELVVKNIMVEVLDHVYLQKPDEVITSTFIMGENPARSGNLIKLLKEDPTSILIHPKEGQVDELRRHLVKEHAEVIEQRVWGAPWEIIEIVRAGMNKAVGLRQIANFLNIPQERIIAFGDEDNDFEMIEYAGHGVAMGNAIDELKQLANFVTKTNEEDGIAYYLEEVLSL